MILNHSNVNGFDMTGIFEFDNFSLPSLSTSLPPLPFKWI
jgi:hypothetical protein